MLKDDNKKTFLPLCIILDLNPPIFETCVILFILSFHFYRVANLKNFNILCNEKSIVS